MNTTKFKQMNENDLEKIQGGFGPLLFLVGVGNRVITIQYYGMGISERLSLY